jgi:hypothetical protein
MKRLLGNLILLALIFLVVRYGIVGTILCWQAGGEWKMLEQTCSLGVIDVPSDSLNPSPIENGVQSRIDFSTLKEFGIRIPDTDTTTVTLARTNDALVRFVASFPQQGTNLEGFAEADVAKAVVDEATGLSLVPFVVNYGGTGSFVYVGLFENASGTPAHRDSLLLGDRVTLESVSFSREGSELRAVVNFKDRKPEEAMAVVPHLPVQMSAPIIGTAFGQATRGARSDSAPLTYKDVLKVTSPASGSTVESPFTVTGEARGNWFFEASFPITVVDWDGKIIGEGFAGAMGEWMTTDYVPFEASIQYQLPADIPYRRGALILQKDNPSGLPENDDALEIPINFK